MLCLTGPTTAPDGSNHEVNGQGKATTGNNEKRRAKCDQQAASRGKRIATPHDVLPIGAATPHDALPITIASGALST
jgi:hypothetical protein